MYVGLLRELPWQSANPVRPVVVRFGHAVNLVYVLVRFDCRSHKIADFGSGDRET